MPYSVIAPNITANVDLVTLTNTPIRLPGVIFQLQRSSKGNRVTLDNIIQEDIDGDYITVGLRQADGAKRLTCSSKGPGNLGQ